MFPALNQSLKPSVVNLFAQLEQRHKDSNPLLAGTLEQKSNYIQGKHEKSTNTVNSWPSFVFFCVIISSPEQYFGLDALCDPSLRSLVWIVFDMTNSWSSPTSHPYCRRLTVQLCSGGSLIIPGLLQSDNSLWDGAAAWPASDTLVQVQLHSKRFMG